MENKLTEFGSFSAEILIETIIFFSKSFSFLTSLASEPLFSIFVSLYSLILLYFPRIFLHLVFSPILISTGILLLTLLRLGSIQTDEKENILTEPKLIDSPDCETGKETENEFKNEMGFNTKPFFFDSVVEWSVGAPLEVIYEEYEGEEDGDFNDKEEIGQVGPDGLASLALYYPESDSCSSSDIDFQAIDGWDSLENMCFMWDEEDRDGLIEIPLNGERGSVFQVEEDNLIEIEISPVLATGGRL